MGHAFITLRRLDQAQRVAAEAIRALSPLAEHHDCPPETLSLYGAMHLILSVVYAREGNRQATRRTLDQALQIATRVGPGRNDYNTEFGPTNVELHAVAASVDLGDAGEAISLSAGQCGRGSSAATGAIPTERIPEGLRRLRACLDER